MNKESIYNMLRGCVLASGLENPTKRELIEFVTKLENQEDYIEDEEN